MRSVYIIAEEGADALKIGCAIDPHKRCADLQIGMPRPLCVVFSAVSERADRAERIAHKLLKSNRANGEWFFVTVGQAIAAVRQAIAEAEQESLPIDESFAGIIRRWPVRAQFAREIGTYQGLCQQWERRDFIPCEWWCAIVAAAAARGLTGVSLELLARLAEQRRLALAEAERAA